MPVTAVSLFSGCGGFDLGARNASVQILWANDIDRYAAATYSKYLPEVEFVLSDIRDLDMRRIPEADLLIGCYPCQGFSSGAWRRWKGRGRRDLFENPDNFLFLEFIKAVPYVRPRFVFIENVKGLRSSAGGWFFEAQVEALQKVGFRASDWSINAKDYGIPQSRNRIFIVGVRNDLKCKYEFPAETHGPGKRHPYATQFDAIGGMPLWPVGEFEDARFHGHYLTRNRKKPWTSYSYTIVANHRHVPLHPAGEPMVKLGKDHWALQGTMNRRLSWRECVLLQSLGVDFEPDGPLFAKYRQVGNAVPPALSELLVRPAVKYLQTQRPSRRSAR